MNNKNEFDIMFISDTIRFCLCSTQIYFKKIFLLFYWTFKLIFDEKAYKNTLRKKRLIRAICIIKPKKSHK